jgi:hypothetical protein
MSEWGDFGRPRLLIMPTLSPPPDQAFLIEVDAMWEFEHAVEADVSAKAVWRLWADVEGWGEWNADIESIEIGGPFEVGTEIAMTPRGQELVRLQIAELDEGRLFVDEADVGDAIVQTEHRIDQLGDGRIRITYRTEITGSAADELGPEIGPAITSDFPETIASLIERARV